MKNMKIKLLTVAIGLLVSGGAAAIDALKEFESNTPAKAEEVNDNFKYLDERINAVGSNPVAMDIDCGADPGTLGVTLANAHFAGPLTLNVTGTCTGPIEIKKDNVSIIGGTIVSESDSIGVSGYTNIRLTDVTIQSGPVYISRESFVRFNNVSMYTPIVEDTYLTGDWYEGNVEVRSSTLRIESGSLDDLSLIVGYNSYARINADVTGTATQIIVEYNSSLQSKLDDLSVSGALELFTNSSLTGKQISVGNLLVNSASTFEARRAVVDNWAEANQGGVINIEGSGASPIFKTKAMECHGSSLYMDGDVEFTGQDPEAGGKSFEAHHGCVGEIIGTATFAEGYTSYKSALEVGGVYLEDK